ncbi:hypothetical protein SAMN05216419_100187 [Nitrosomonas cryotolerans]|uniref:hypothetical protein n=1 Tax=Nitrosomonas cryotolerans TaxID=44575 RepID=UPI0008F1C4C5|nr:hypothetical protein [Nitrosomonas cryotolerans]SFP34928.1 hypothetical protein SAMN05216419_100187 [Nitrosomonas cryotolerans]
MKPYFYIFQLKKTLLDSVAPLLLSGALIFQIALVNAGGDHHEHHKNKNYAQFNKNNDLLRPRNYRESVFVDTPATSNDMNDGKPAFPEFHTVYIDPASWKYWKKRENFGVVQ